MTGKERRSWHPAGAERTDAERLAARLASDRAGRNDEVRSLTLGAYLTSRWLPGKRIALAATTYNGYRRNVENHIVPAVGRIGLRRLRPHHLEVFYDGLLHPSDDRAALAPKTVYEIHLVIRGALEDAARPGLVTRNVALVAHAPRLRSIPRSSRSPGLPRNCRRSCKPPPATGCSRHCGSRRSPGCDATNCSGCAGKTSTTRRPRSRSIAGCRCPLRTARIDLDPTTVEVLTAWRHWQRTEQSAAGIHSAGWMFTDGRGEPIHPHAISQTFERIARRADVTVIRLHDVRHTHGTLLITAGVPVKVVTERLGHATPAFTIDTYQHVLPGRQADAARVFEQLVVPGLLPATTTSEKTREKGRKKLA